MPKLAGITKVRNESHIIRDTLDHFGKFCDALYVYDDCSTDDTAEIAKRCGAVVIRGNEWNVDRMEAEYQCRKAVLDRARQDNPEWLLYFDADERIEWDFKGYKNYDAVRMKLFDFYITPEDEFKTFKERRWIGPECREIIMLFKNHPDAVYCFPDQREIFFSSREPRVLNAGYVKHYGKAISVAAWERKCDYYAAHFPEPYRSKWYARKGKAIHPMRSDFKRPLILWEERETKGKCYG